ncbi:hypothetical protein [Maribacter sp. 2304DJ31-5]|uniref:hypothetical protein n=1 Tax=Maribacter sp. 2304DJ31-5 TaxID=3386273 RepID=UPI0039BCC5AB
MNSPSAKVHFKSGGQGIKFLTGTNTSSYSLDVGVNDNGVNFTNNSAIRGFNFSNSNGSLLDISRNGSVSIATASTGSHKLAVGGSIGAREIKVEVGTWSDFVFYKDYNLPTLMEVEKHIQEKGHLKDIPSAQDVAQNGINLGEMNAKLLQKIEELMLYTIQQEKEINELKSFNKSLLEL